MISISESEKKLIQGILRDDEAAFCELYALYKDRLMYFAMRYVKSREFAEDVFQDAFASVWQNRRFLNPDLPFGPYIYTIIKNRILNLLAGIHKESELKKAILSHALEVTNETENTVLEADFGQLLSKAFEQLTPQQKRIFRLSRNEMKSHKEIAEELGLSVYTVQQHISAALKIIRAYLKKYADTYADLLLLLVCLNL